MQKIGKKLLWRKQLFVAQLISIKTPCRQASDYYKGFTAPATGAKTQKWGEESTETKASVSSNTKRKSISKKYG